MGVSSSDIRKEVQSGKNKFVVKYFILHSEPNRDADIENGADPIDSKGIYANAKNFKAFIGSTQEKYKHRSVSQTKLKPIHAT